MKWRGLAVSILLAACVPQLTGAPCRTDDNCPVNQYCDGTNCQAGPPPATRVVQLVVTAPAGILPLGSTVQASATAVLQSGAQQDVTADATWSSTDTRVAQVSNDAGSTGVVLALATGEVNVDATLGANSGSTHLVVTDAQLMSLVVTVDRPVVAVRTDVVCTAMGFFTDGTHADLSSLATWASSQPAVVSVSATPGSVGAVVALSAGTAEVSATYQHLSGSTTVTVTDASLIGVSISPLLPWVGATTTAQLVATGLFSDGTAQPLTGSVQWTVDDPSLAYFLPSLPGELQGFAPGNTDVEAQAGSLVADAPLLVSAAAISTLEVAPQLPDTVGIGGAPNFTSWGTFSDQGVLDLSTQVSWNSTNQDLLAVLPGSGTASALDAGEASIEASFGVSTASATQSVDSASPTTVWLWPPTSVFTVGLPTALVAERVLEDGTVDDVSQLAGWTSSCPQQVEVATGTRGGAVVARAAKTCTISAKLGGLSGSNSVQAIPRAVQRLEVSPTQVGLGPGGWGGFTATAVFSDGSLLDVTSLAGWASTSEALVLAGNGPQAGQTVAADAGVAQLSATFGGATASSVVTVDAQQALLEVWPPLAQLHAFTTRPLRATTVWPLGDAVDVTAWTVFFSSNPAVAAVANAAGARGVLAALSPGFAVVTARFGLATASMPVVVDAPTPLRLAVSGPSALPTGETASFQATAQYSDGSQTDVTGQSSWTSSAPSFLRLRGTGPSRGAAVALGVGSSNAQVRFGAITGSTAVATTTGGLQSLGIQAVPSSVPVGVQTQLFALADYPDGVQLDITSRAVWTSLSPGVASVANGPHAGLLTALSSGAVQVAAMFEGIESNVPLTVTTATLNGLTILPAAPNSPVGVGIPLQAQGNFSDGSQYDLTQQARWSSANAALLAVSNGPQSRGIAMALVAGTGTISASFISPGATLTTASVPFVGGPPAVVGIEIVPAQVTLSLSGTASVNLRATGHLSDGSARDVTAQVSWNVQNGAIAVVTASGQLTALNTGNTLVLAGLGALVGSAPVAVNP